MEVKGLARKLAELFADDILGFYKTEKVIEAFRAICEKHLTEVASKELEALSPADLETVVIGDQDEAVKLISSETHELLNEMFMEMC